MSNHALVATGEAAALTINAQAVLDFTLIGTRLKMAFSRVGGVNTFVILPLSKEPAAGMTIDDMIKDIDALLSGYDSSLSSGLTNKDISGAIEDVNTAANTNDPETGYVPANIDYTTIRISLRQAFLLIATGKPVEFALEIDVDLSGLFDPAQSFVAVEKLSLAVWNTGRQSILNRMNIIEVSKLLEEE